MTTDGAPADSLLDGPAARPPRVRPLEVVALVALAGFGAFVRAHGFSGADLWFDDAWAAMPAKVGLAAATHMVLTAPGYSLVLRSWLRLDPATTWWAQLPAFVLGVLAIPAVYALVRWFRAPRWLAFGTATVVALSPVAVQYATRVKEYPFDLLSACVLLVLAERLRRSPSPGRLVALAVGSAVAFGVSAGTAPVVAGVWLATVALVVPLRRLRGPLLGAAAATGAAAIAVWAVFLRRLPGVLNTNWRRRGFLVDYRSLPRAERSVTIILGGFVHAVLAVPVPVSFYRGARGLHDPLVAVVGLVVLLVAILVPVVASWRHRRVAPALGASLTLVVAVALAVADRVPLGDGRTDEVLYPALLVCLAAAVAATIPWWRRRLGTGRSARVLPAALGVVLVAGSVVFGAAHRAVYPTISLRGVWHRLAPLVRPGDVVMVDTFNSFGWCYYGLTACTVKVGGEPLWPQGFRPVSACDNVFLPTHYGIPEPEFSAAAAHAERIWYVGYTLGTFDAGANPSKYHQPVATYLTGLLHRDGWRVAGSGPGHPTSAVLGLHAYALLYVHRGHRAPVHVAPRPTSANCPDALRP